MRNRRTAFFCSSTSWGGLEMNVGRFAHWFHERGEDCLVMAVENSPLAEFARENHIPLHLISRHRKYFDFGNARKLAKSWSQLEIDNLWIRDTRDMDIVFWAKKFSSRRVNVIYQQAMQLGISKKDLVHTLRFKSIDTWISPLQFLADQVKTMTRFPEERIEIIPLAVDVERYAALPSKEKARNDLELPSNRVLLGNVGRIDPLKGQAFLLEAFAKLAPDHPELDLLIMGDPTRNEGEGFLQSLQEKATALQLEERIHFRPHRPDVETAYAAIDLFAMTSVGETFGMVTIEAMASGLPIIGTNTSGTPELLEHGNAGLLYTPGDIDEFCHQLTPWLNNLDSATAVGRRAQQSAQSRFSKASVLSRLEKLL